MKQETVESKIREKIQNEINDITVTLNTFRQPSDAQSFNGGKIAIHNALGGLQYMQERVEKSINLLSILQEFLPKD